MTTTTPPKIADGLPNAKDILGDRFTTASTNDGKLWFVSRKFAEQPSISYFHETPLHGGRLVNFDTRSKTWSESFAFEPISIDDELLEGEVFGFKNRLLLLTYRRSKRFEFEDLYEWSEAKKEWSKLTRPEADEKTKFDCGDHTSLHRVGGPDGDELYFVVERGHSVNICKFRSDGKTTTITVTHDDVSPIPDRATGAHLVRAAIAGRYMYGIYGQQGCGFRWCPTRPFRIDLTNGAVEHFQIGDETSDQKCPPWSFSGAYADHFVSPTHWFFFGGCRARGLSSTEDDGSIWIMDLEKKEWNRFTQCDLPTGARFVGAFGEKMYAANVESGVFEIELL